MSKVANLHKEWLKDPEYQTAYENMGEEFELASAILKARSRAGLTQTELASRMSAKQSLIARLEAGGQNTTIKTLQRIAEATGTHLKISFE
jgi:predicted transcriptional regulator